MAYENRVLRTEKLSFDNVFFMLQRGQQLEKGTQISRTTDSSHAKDSNPNKHANFTSRDPSPSSLQGYSEPQQISSSAGVKCGSSETPDDSEVTIHLIGTKLTVKILAANCDTWKPSFS